MRDPSQIQFSQPDSSFLQDVRNREEERCYSSSDTRLQCHYAKSEEEAGDESHHRTTDEGDCDGGEDEKQNGCDCFHFDFLSHTNEMGVIPCNRRKVPGSQPISVRQNEHPSVFRRWTRLSAASLLASTMPTRVSVPCSIAVTMYCNVGLLSYFE